MKQLKRRLKLLFYIILIVLASIGIGISGPIPVPNIRKKDENNEIHSETPKDKENDTTDESTVKYRQG